MKYLIIFAEIIPGILQLLEMAENNITGIFYIWLFFSLALGKHFGKLSDSFYTAFILLGHICGKD